MNSASSGERLIVQAWRVLLLLASSSSAVAAIAPVISTESLPDKRVRLVWTNAGDRAVLQRAGTISSLIPWEPASEAVTLDGNRYSAVLDFQGTTRFYRLLVSGEQLTTCASSPAHGESGVAVTRETILTFNQPLAANTLFGSNTLFAEFAGRRILSRVELSSDRRKATLFYLEDLPASARIRVTFDATGIEDVFGRGVDGDHDGAEGGVGTIEFDTLSITPVPATAILGRVFASHLAPNPTNANQSVNVPLQGVIITVDGAEETLRATTDANGFFRLEPCPAGRFFVHVDGRMAVGSSWPNGDYYPFIGKAWEAAPGQTNNLAAGTGEIFLPLIKAGSLQPVSAITDTTITFPPDVVAANPALDGVHVIVPANSLFGDNGVRGGRVGIAPVPPDRLPEPLPAGLEMPIVITVQTDGGLNFDRPAPVRFPNLPVPGLNAPLPPGSKQALVSFNHDKGIWEAVGSMTVTLDGQFVVSDPGTGILQPGWHGVGPPPVGPQDPGPCGGGSGGGGGAAGAKIAKDASCRENCHLERENKGLDCLEDIVENALACAGGGAGAGAAACAAGIISGPAVPLCAAVGGTIGGTICSVGTLARCILQDGNARQICDSLPPCNPPPACAAAGAGGAESTFAANGRAKGATTISPETADQIAVLLQQVQAEIYPFAIAGTSIPSNVLNQVNALLLQADGLAGGGVAAFLQELQAEFGRMIFEPDLARPGNAPAYPIRYAAAVSRTNGQPLILRGYTEANGEYQLFVPRDGRLQFIWFYDERARSAGVVYPFYESFRPDLLPRVNLKPLSQLNFLDFDGDQSPDFVEFVYGSNPASPDTDNDGVPDGAEVDQGTDPLDGRPVITGVVASVSTSGSSGAASGNAVDICALNNFAVMANGAGGVVVFDATNPFQPVQAAVIPTLAPATAVACAGNLVAVAQGEAGLAVIDISTPSTATKLYDLALGSSANAVVTRGNTAFVGTRNGFIIAVDLPTETILDRFQIGTGAVQDLTVSGETLYVLTVGEVITLALDEERLRVTGTVPSPGVIGAGGRRLRLFVGGNLALATRTEGYNVFDLTDPRQPQLVQNNITGQFGWKQIVANGSGLGLAAVGVNSTDDGPHNVSLYDLGPSGTNGQFLTTLATPGIAEAVSIFNGLAYVADGRFGLQVINYLPFDALGVSPQISLATSFPLTNPSNGVVESGQLLTLTALVSDDVQVRSVEFHLDGQLVVTDGNFPFEQVMRAPLLSPTKTNFTVRAKATDTGGNSTFSPEVLVRIVADATRPRIVSRFPAANGFEGAVDAVIARINERIDAAWVSYGSSVIASAAGVDGVLDTPDDVPIANGAASYRAEDDSVVVTFSSGLAPGLYRIAIGPPIADLSGNVMLADSWTFFVLGTADSDQDGVPNAIEVALGLNPNDPDSDDDGILDGDEDLDGDNLPTRWELQFGYDPQDSDSDNNLVRDDQEDPDNDALRNIAELTAETHPRLTDTDNDGWNDEAEVTGGSHPTNPFLRPLRAFIAQPPVRVIVPGVGSPDGLPFNTFVANPPVRMTVPGIGSSEGLPFNTFMAQPPVRIIVPGVGTNDLPFNTFVAQPPVQVRIE